LFSIKNLVNKATEYKKGSTTKEEVEKKLDELSLTDTQKKEMLILFDHYFALGATSKQNLDRPRWSQRR
jgi:inorganic pyrophosphatase